MVGGGAPVPYRPGPPSALGRFCSQGFLGGVSGVRVWRAVVRSVRLAGGCCCFLVILFLVRLGVVSAFVPTLNTRLVLLSRGLSVTSDMIRV